MADGSQAADTGTDAEARGWLSRTSRWQKIVGVVGLVILLGPGMGLFGPGSDQGGPGRHGPGGDTPLQDANHTPPVDFDH